MKQRLKLPSFRQQAAKIIHRCDELGAVTDEPGMITRTFASPAMKRANSLVGSWMKEAGMACHQDAVGNLIGHYGDGNNGRPILLLGSHLDTVKDAGRYDGPLGVMLAIACVEYFHTQNIRLPFDIRIVGFADEEGVRYHTTYLGSKALAGCFDAKDLKRADADGVRMADAIREFGGEPTKLKSCAINPRKLIGYLEAHIEQGPVLEKENLSVGVVTSIAGQSRHQIQFLGKANHAGTTPMDCRNDALCGASEFILAVEKFARQRKGLVATVGIIRALPGASNVIPGEVNLTLDTRHQSDSIRENSSKKILSLAKSIAAKRKLQTAYKLVQSTPSSPCSGELTRLLGSAVLKKQKRVIHLPSGAGHDAVVLSKITPSAMLFIRCKGGVSHHPDESVKAPDVQVAFEVMTQFIETLAQKNHG